MEVCKSKIQEAEGWKESDRRNDYDRQVQFIGDLNVAMYMSIWIIS